MILAPKSFYFDHGPRAIILLHAFASGPVDVRLLARNLEHDDYSIYAPLFSGHGKDFEAIINEGSPEKWWQDTENAIQFLKDQGKTQISIFGISLGGMFAARALELHPELLGGGSFGSPIDTHRSFKVHRTFLQMAAADYDRKGVPKPEAKERLAWLDKNIDDLLLKISDFAADVAVDLPKIVQPYFIGQGTADQIIDPASSKRLSVNLVNSHVSYHEYVGASHMITVNSAHKQLEANVVDFLKKLY